MLLCTTTTRYARCCCGVEPFLTVKPRCGWVLNCGWVCTFALLWWHALIPVPSVFGLLLAAWRHGAHVCSGVWALENGEATAGKTVRRCKRKPENDCACFPLLLTCSVELTSSCTPPQKGVTALSKAAFGGHLKVCKLLVELGNADVSEANFSDVSLHACMGACVCTCMTDRCTCQWPHRSTPPP